MAIPIDPRARDQLSTYIWPDRLTDKEIVHHQLQEYLMTAAMGGVLPEQPDLAGFKRVLDIGCGSGSWLIELAEVHPDISQLTGIDAGSRILEIAQEQAEIHKLSDRLLFRQMDALNILDFPSDSFDLVNLRFGSSFLRTWEWSGLLREMVRLTEPGGIIRIIEPDIIKCKSPVLARHEALVLHALHQSGHLFTQQNDGLSRELVPLLVQQGLSDIQTRSHPLRYQNGAADQRLIENFLIHGFRLMQPFLQKWARKPENTEELLQQVYQELQNPDFDATTIIHTIWATIPS